MFLSASPGTVAGAALRSWPLDPLVIALLAATGGIYLRGWRRMTRILPRQFPGIRAASFTAGLTLLFIALESPLDAFSSLLLQAHMVQHLLLMMVAPPLILLGQPFLPLLRGLPKPFVKEGLGPFLRWRPLRQLAGFLTAPAFAWAVFNVSVVAWHVPALYETALHSPAWHGVEHACFFWTAILFWWPVVQPWPSDSRWARWAAVPYLLTADLVNTGISASFVFADKAIYPTYAAGPLSGISPASDQVAAGLIMWVPGSIFYLVPAVVIAMELIGGSSRQRAAKHSPALVQIGKPRAWGSRFIRWHYARPVMQSIMFVAAAAVVADGLWGPKMAPMNLAGVLPWIHWRALVVVALLSFGNLFCMACPFMLPRNLSRRLLKPTARWPRPLRSKWLAAALLLLYFWAYEAFSLWNSPAATAWIVIGYFLLAFAVDGIFRGASFCKYVCPLGQFNFVTSLISPVEVKVRSESVCRTCQTYDCIRGNERERGCELYLFQPRKESNFDCTFCLDCVHACPHDNVALMAVVPGASLTRDPYRSSIGRFSRRTDIAAMAAVIVFGAYVNALMMTGPFAQWEASYLEVNRPLRIAALIAIAIVVVPAVCLWLCAAVSKRFAAPGESLKHLVTSFTFVFVPVGAAMWGAHLLYHLATGAWTAVPVFERVLGAAHPDWALSAQVLLPAWVSPLQILLLDAGLLFTLYLAWRAAKSWRLFLPWGLLAGALYIGGVWILLQPMQMRGTMTMMGLLTTN